jgi:hypothetical protein
MLANENKNWNKKNYEYLAKKSEKKNRSVCSTLAEHINNQNNKTEPVNIPLGK